MAALTKKEQSSDIDYNNPILSLDFNEVGLATSSSSPTDYIHTYSGHVLAYNDMTDEHVPIAEFKLHYMDMERAKNDGMTKFNLFDATAEISEFGDLYEGASYDLTQKVQDVLSPGDEIPNENYNIVIIETLVVLPEHRGHGVSKVIIDAFIKRFDHGVSFFALKAFPLQLDGKNDTDYKRYELHGFNQDEVAAKDKLITVYNGANFMQIPNSQMMVYPSQRR